MIDDAVSVSANGSSDISKISHTDEKQMNGKSSFEHIKKESNDVFTRPENAESLISSDLTEERKASEVQNKPILKTVMNSLGQFNQTMRKPYERKMSSLLPEISEEVKPNLTAGSEDDISS